MPPYIINIFRKVFNKALKETMRLSGAEKGQAEVISGINNIQDKDNFFAGLARRNKEFNKNNVKYTLTKDGKVLLNSVHTIDPSDFANLGTSDRITILSNLTPQQPGISENVFLKTSTTVNNWFEQNLSSQTKRELGSAAVKILSTLLNSGFSKEGIALVLSDLQSAVINYILSIYVEFYSRLESIIFDILMKIFPLVDPRMAILQFLKNALQEMARALKIELETFLKMFFNQNGSVQEAFIDTLREKLNNWLKSLEERNRPADPFIHGEKTPNFCKVCNGIFWNVQ